jgi:hypothetical protein
MQQPSDSLTDLVTPQVRVRIRELTKVDEEKQGRGEGAYSSRFAA